MSYDKISLGRLRFWIHVQDAVYSLQQFGEGGSGPGPGDGRDLLLPVLRVAPAPPGVLL